MSLFDEIRAVNPAARELSDEDIIKKTAEMTGMSLMDTAKEFGVSPKRGVLGAANDWVIEGANAAAGGVKAAIDLVAPGSKASRAVGDFIRSGEEKQSFVAQDAKRQLQTALDSEDSWEGVKGAAKYALQNPMLAASQAAGSFAGPGLAIKGARGAAGALGLAEKSIERAGSVAGMGSSAVLSGGDAAGSAYDAVMNSEQLRDVPEYLRRQMAEDAARKASVVPAVIGGVAGRFGAEGALAKGGTKSILKTGAQEFASEAIEEGSTQLSANLAAGQYDPTINPMKGVAGAATLGGILGGGTGLGVGLMTKREPTSLLGGSTPSQERAADNDGTGLNSAIDSGTNVPQTGTVMDAARAPVQTVQSINPAPQQPQQPAGPTPEEVAAQVQQQQQIQAQQQQERRNAALGAFGVAPNQQGIATFFGNTVAGPARINALADALAPVVENTPQHKMQILGAMMKAEQSLAMPMIKSSFVAQDPKKSAANAMAAIDKAMAGLQIDEAQSVEEAVGILNELSKTAKGKQLDQINAVHEALTGKDTEGFLANQGAKNGKVQLQQQDASRVGAVPKQGGASQASRGDLGLLRPQQVQSVGAGSQPVGSPNEQNVGGGEGGARVSPGEPTTASISNDGTSQAPQVTEVQSGQPTSNADLARANEGAAATAQLGEQVLPEGGRGNPAPDGSTVQAEQASPERVVQDVLELVIQRKGSMKAADVSKYRDFIRLYMGGVNDEMLPVIANDYLGITIDQAKKWNKKAKTFLEDNAEALNAAIEQIAQKYGMQPEQVFALAPSEDQVTTEKPLIEEVGGGVTTVDQKELASLNEEGEATDADIKGSKTKGISVQEQFNDAETINAKYLRIAEELAKAEAKGDSAKVAKLEAQLMQVVSDAERVGKRKERQIRNKAGADEDTGKPAPKAADKTAQIWDKQAKEYGLPKFSELSPGAQADWIASVKKGKTGLAAMNKVFEDNQKAFKMNDDADTQDDEGVETSLEDLQQQYQSVQTVSDEYDFLGIGHALNLVTRWGISQKGSDGSYNGMKGGRQRVTFRADRIAGNGGLAFVTVSHEIGHAVDRAAFGGVYSSQPEFGLAVMDGELIPTGAVMREMYNLYKTDPDGWGEYLGYPFDHDAYPKLSENPGRIRAELFSQLWAAYTKPNLRRMLQKDAPVAHKFMEEVITHVRASTKVQPSTTKIAERQALDFASRNPEGRFEDSEEVGIGEQYDSIQKRKDEVVGRAKSVIDNLPTWARGPVRGIHNALFGGKGTALGIMITEDVAELAAKHMPAVKDFVEVQHLRNSLTAEKERRLTTIKTKFEDLSANDRRAVNGLIADMTVNGKWAFDPGYLKNKPDLDEALKNRFNALPSDAQFVVKEVFKVGHDNLLDKQQTITKKIDEAFAAKEAEAETEADKKQVEREKAQMTKQFAGVLGINPNTPYAPLKRFGSFVVVAKSQAYKDAEALNDKKAMEKMKSDEAHYIVEFAETAGEAEEIYDTLRKASGYDVTPPYHKSKARDSLYRGTDLYQGFAKLKRLIQAEQGVDAGNDVLKELEGMVNQLYLLSLAESSARKSEMQRKKIAGYNRDMMRSFFTQGMADAHYIANLKTSDKSMDAMLQMQKQAKGNEKVAHPYLNELMAREAQSLEVREPSLGDAMNRMTGDWFLTFSPAFYFQQLTQTYVLSLPWLAGKYNYFKSERALRAAYKDVLPLIKETGLKEHMDFSKAPEDVREMLKVLVGRGRIDIGVEAELGGFRSEGGNAVFDAYGKVANRFRGAINRIEALNRSVAAIAAYRLEMQKSGNKAKAIEAADKVVHVTHGSYDGFNTPRLFNQNAVTRSVTQFRRFQIIQLTMLGRMLKSAFQGATPTEKAMGRKQLMFLMAHSGVLGGVKGMPIYVPAALLYAIAKGAFGDDDDPEDFEAWLRSEGGLLLARGVPAELGVDLSGKLGMGNVLSLLPYTDIDLTSRGGYEKVVAGLTGPFIGGLLPRMLDGVNLVAGGDYYRGLEQMLPNGLSNGIKTVRFLNEGITQRNGDVVMGPEDIGFADAALQAVGLPTTTMTERQYRQGQTIKYDQFYNERSKELKNQYTKAVRANDTAQMADLRDQWVNLQQSRVKNGYDRKPLSDLMKAPREQMKRERGVVGGVETKKSNRGFVQSLTDE